MSLEFPAAGIGDGVVALRLMSDADVEAVVEAVRDPDIARYTTVPHPYGEGEARHWKRTSQAGLAAGTDLATLIVDPADDRLLGAVGLHGIHPTHRRCSAGYWVAAGERGAGIASRALDLICVYGFDELGLERIELWIEPVNTHSIRVAERAGFVREGILRSFMVVAGRRRDMLMYARLPEVPG